MKEQSKQINEGKEERHELKETQSKHATKFQTMGQKQDEQTKEWKEWKEKQQDMKGISVEKEILGLCQWLYKYWHLFKPLSWRRL